MLRKTIAMIMAIAIVGGTMCTTATVNDKDRFTAVAAEADEIIEPDEDGIVTKDGVKYEIYNGDTWVVGYTKDLKGDLVIPEKINGVPVTIIDDKVFANCAEITSVTIPASILSIGEYAFKNCEKLTSVDIRSNCTGNGAFTFCPNIEKLTLSSEDNDFEYALFHTNKLSAADYDADKYIYDEARSFLIPKSLKTVEITEGTSIGTDEFKGMSSLETVILPDSIEDIGWAAFEGCTALKSINLPKNLTVIGSYAFSGCESLEEIVLPDSLEEICEGAFNGCTSLKTIDLPKNLKTIGKEAFANCAGITSVTIPASVKTVGQFAFKNCEKLKSADIKNPDIFNASISVSDWSGFFAFCPNLEKVTYAADGNSNFKATLFYTGKLSADDYDADKYTYESSYGMLIPKSLKTIEITEGTTINEEEFKDIASLETIHLPKNLETIGEEAFSGCENIKELVLPDSLKTIEDFAFYGLTNIKSVTVPASVEHIGQGAFACCDSLTSANFAGDIIQEKSDGIYTVVIGFNENGATSVNYGSSYGIFCFCHKLEKVSFNNADVESLASFLFETTESAVKDNNMEEFVVTAVDESYAGKKHLYAIPKSFRTIEMREGKTVNEKAFKDLSTVENIIIPDTIEVVGDEAFSGCSSIKSFDMPKDLKIIGDYAFSGMKGITSVKVPASVVYVGEGSFSECDNLTSAEFEGSYFKDSEELKKCYESLYKSEFHLSFYDWKGIFRYCPKLERVSCPAENDVGMARYFFQTDRNDIKERKLDDYVLTSSNDYYKEPESPYVIPKSFKTVTITDGETLSEASMANLKTLENVSLPDSLKEIGVSSFSECSGLKSIDIPENVTLIGDWAFAGCNNIDELVLPEKLETIGNEAFCGMDSLTSAVLPASVKKVGYELFGYCNNLRSLKLESTPEISAKPDTWPAPDVNVGMVLYCPNIETVETKSNVFTLTNEEGEEKKISSLDAFFGGDYLNIPEGDEDKYKNDNPDYVIPKSLKAMITDIGDSIYGDANHDGTVDISDAVLIMQSLSNPSKYKLSDEARTAADVAGNSDGVTNADALAIQKYLLKIISTLPDTE
ncbi:MAG TPA: leucine-rich repeat protein [Ruminococcus flavefaciens]|nr:leucine-rich repeat protein [Ruminococcus flavefaciens]HQL99576.1 leucine-rich repeat protein [Ruminococcus flavefaciens]